MNAAAAPSPEQRNRETFFSVVSQHVDALYQFVRHELAYRASVGDLMKGEPTAEDVVDAVLLRAYRDFVKERPAGSTRAWLIDLAKEHIAEEVKRLKQWREPVRTEGEIPETSPTEEVSTPGDEILDLYEPDDDVELGAVVPDLDVPTPEEVTESKELRWCVRGALASLPRQWRRALLLHYADGLGGAEIARSLGKPEREVERILNHARAYLRQRLIESNCGITERDSRVA